MFTILFSLFPQLSKFKNLKKISKNDFMNASTKSNLLLEKILTLKIRANLLSKIVYTDK